MKKLFALGALTLTGLAAAGPAQAEGHTGWDPVAPVTAGPLAALGNWHPDASAVHVQQLSHVTPSQAGDGHTVTDALAPVIPLG